MVHAESVHAEVHGSAGASTREPARKRLVMTGGTSGIGRRVVERLLAEYPDWATILLARPSARLRELCGTRGCERLKVIDTDLASLKSIDHVSNDAASMDGLELAFAVNFLAHFLIVERLKAHMRSGGRIVSTTSEVHDPEAFCLVGIGRATWQDPVLLADPVQAQM